ncbi:MAG: asparagine synthase (glutamine-hydrolyzing) [Castellaniella sp.]|uniref:asparagine synthase (glutamine-hydrolyzing) n=1 Tax=Castellaniella sp. TaxID=1955812 RepID=UPI003C7645CD
MCGIAGLFLPNSPVPINCLREASWEIRHRGPDDEGFVCLRDGVLCSFRGSDTIGELRHLPSVSDAGVATLGLLHRRLSIIDPTPAGHQPMFDESRSAVIVFNGEIFNYLELRTELEKAGRRFLTRTDTEVALQAYLEWGVDAFGRFNGMWALAIWEQHKERLILCRDRFGVKPLFYAVCGDGVRFASEIKALLALSSKQSYPFDRDAMRDYLERCSLFAGNGTFWQGVSELPPGTWMTLDSNGCANSGRYWHLVPEERPINASVAQERFAELFEDSLRLRMRSDVEVGTLLSGGLDSNSIVFGLQKLGFIDGGKFNSFSATFDSPSFDESHYIRTSLAKLSVQPHWIKPSPNDLAEDLPRLLRHTEVPFRSLSVYSQFKIYEYIKANTRVRVVLNGQGADELFGGYGYHHYWRFIELLRQMRLIQFGSEAKKFLSDRGGNWYRLLRQLAGVVAHASRGMNSLNHHLFNEVAVAPLREYLSYDDRTSMSASIEARTPFLDYRLVEFAFTLSSDFKICNGQNKKIERDYARTMVPRMITDRRDKMGFVSPQEEWQRNEMAPDLARVFAAIDERVSDVLHSDVQSLYRRYVAGEQSLWPKIWRLYCAHYWCDLWNPQ